MRPAAATPEKNEFPVTIERSSPLSNRDGANAMIAAFQQPGTGSNSQVQITSPGCLLHSAPSAVPQSLTPGGRDSNESASECQTNEPLAPLSDTVSSQRAFIAKSTPARRSDHWSTGASVPFQAVGTDVRHPSHGDTMSFVIQINLFFALTGRRRTLYSY